MKSLILLIEDTEDLGENIYDILVMEGYQVQWERNGLCGWEVYTKTKPDLIITDVVMPHLDGLSLVKKIRSVENDKKIPIVILSARATPEDKQRGLEAGATIYLNKPCKSAVLIDTVCLLLKGKA